MNRDVLDLLPAQHPSLAPIARKLAVAKGLTLAEAADILDAAASAAGISVVHVEDGITIICGAWPTR